MTVALNSKMEVRFRTPFTMVCAGSTQSGKTTHVRNMLLSMPHLFTKVPDRIMYFYSEWQPIFSEMYKDRFDEKCHEPTPAPASSYYVEPLPEQWGAGISHVQVGDDEDPPGPDYGRRPIVNEWINMLPTLDLLRAKTKPYVEGNGSLIIIDDFVQDLDEDISQLFTVLSHANNISVILLTQNLFANNPVYRTISLNAMYITMFKNPRDKSQFTSFAKQISPRNINWVQDAFAACTKSPYSYMTYDSHQATPDLARLRSHFIPGEDGPRTWFQADVGGNIGGPIRRGRNRKYRK